MVLHCPKPSKFKLFSINIEIIILLFQKGFFSKALISSPDKKGAKVDTLVDFNSASNSGIPSFSIDASCSKFTPPDNNGAQLISLNVNGIYIIYKFMNL